MAPRSQSESAPVQRERDQTAANRRLGAILIGLFAILTAFSAIFIATRTH